MSLAEIVKDYAPVAAAAVLVAGLAYSCNEADRRLKGDYDGLSKCCEQLDCWFYEPQCYDDQEEEPELCLTTGAGDMQCCYCDGRELEMLFTVP